MDTPGVLHTNSPVTIMVRFTQVVLPVDQFCLSPIQPEETACPGHLILSINHGSVVNDRPREGVLPGGSGIIRIGSRIQKDVFPTIPEIQMELVSLKGSVLISGCPDDRPITINAYSMV